MIHNLYIFDRNGRCLYYKEWNRDQYTLRESPDEDRKLVFGLIFSLKQFVTSLSPKPYPDSPQSLQLPPSRPAGPRPVRGEGRTPRSRLSAFAPGILHSRASAQTARAAYGAS